MKQITTPNQPTNEVALSRVVQAARRRVIWPVLTVAGLLLTGTGIVLAQGTSATATSTLPTPPAMPAPSAGAPVPPDGGLRDGGPGLRDGGPRDGGPRGGDERGGHRGGPADGPGRDLMDGPDGGPGRGPAGGPIGGPDGARPTPPDANTQEGAGHAIERAYRAIGDTQTANGDAKAMADNARTLYTRAYDAYNAKNYSRAFALADASERMSRTTRALSDADGNGPQLKTVPGLTAPPVIVPKDTDDAGRAARELNRNYAEANRAAKFDNASSNRFRTLSEVNYRTALAAYNAKNYKVAAQKARLGAEQGKAAHEYAETLALTQN